MTKKHFLLVIPLILAMGMFLDSSAQSVVSTTPIGPVWQMERAHLGVSAGQGVALSPDGRALVYMEEPETGLGYASLVLLELATGKKSVLRPSDNFMMPHRPSFSPDGKQVVFVVLGPTWSYRSEIYSVGVDGRGLTKLTKSLSCTEKPANEPASVEHGNCRYYQRYHYSARYSPDGSRILLHIYDVMGQVRDFTAVMAPDGSNLDILAEGQPYGWSADGKAVYYTHKGLLTRMELETRATRTVALPAVEERTPLGRMTGRDWLAFKVGKGRIGWYDVGTGAPVPAFLGQWSVPGVKMAGREKLELKGFNWSGSNEVLLWYQGEDTERFEVVRIFDPTSRSQ